jgi:hypothetical protein
MVALRPNGATGKSDAIGCFPWHTLAQKWIPSSKNISKVPLPCPDQNHLNGPMAGYSALLFDFAIDRDGEHVG